MYFLKNLLAGQVSIVYFPGRLEAIRSLDISWDSEDGKGLRFRRLTEAECLRLFAPATSSFLLVCSFFSGNQGCRIKTKKPLNLVFL